MANNADIRDQAYQFFVEEAPELLQTIESGLLTLRQARETAQVHHIMRAAHSLKGGAASVGLDPIKAIAHRLETIFKALYSDSLVFDSELESQLLAAFDCLRLPLMAQLNQGYFDPDQALAAADQGMAALEQRLAAAIAETENYIPSSTDLGVNMALTIFDIDVGQGLDHLQTVIENPDRYEVSGELRAQAEVFIGFAELLSLSGFASIAQSAITALALNPEQALLIATLAWTDFQSGRAAVLAGDTTTGGSPSAELLALAQSPPAALEALELDAIAALEDLALTEALTLTFEPDSAEPWSDLSPLAAEAAALDADATLLPAAEPAADVAADLQAAPFADLDDAQLEAIFAGFDADLFEPLEATTPAAALAAEAEATTEVIETAETAAATSPAELVELEAAEPVPALLPAAISTTPTPRPAAGASEPLGPGRSAATLTVRVDTERLARIDNSLGELTINRNGLALQNDQLRLGLRELINRVEQVRATVEQLRSASDQMLLNSEHRPAESSAVATNGHRRPVLGSPDQPSFDSLEMDSYNVFYTQTQTLLEEMLQLEEVVEDLSLFNRQSDQLLGQHRKMLSQTQSEVMWARMVPLSEVLNRFPRILRDLANTYHKPAELTIEGANLLIDRAVLEKLYDPLLHLLRNGFDHGLESPEQRQQQGKPESGRIDIQVSYQGRRVVIEVQDDGNGLDLARIQQRLVELGWLTAAEAEALEPAQLCEFIFRPGFSTAAAVSELSGRGMGLDVVREQIEQLKGTVAVRSVAGHGTTFTLSLPLTLSVVNLLICFAGATPIALRSDNIAEILIPRPEQLSQVDGQQHLHWQGQDIPAYRLSSLLSYACLVPEMPVSRVLAAVPSPAGWELPMLVLKRGDRAFALQVERLVTEQESVIKPFSPALNPPSYAYGCTVLGDGSLIPVIDGRAFLDALIAPEGGSVTASVAAIPPELAPAHQATTVLVVDDAVTSRRMLALSLERAGYRILQARDGQEAIEQLQQNPLVQLVVCDIEMPNMNGFEFLTQRRQDPQLAQIPTVMLTSRSNDKHRWLATQLGATDYFTKPYLEQEFLGAIARYLNVPAAAQFSA